MRKIVVIAAALTLFAHQALGADRAVQVQAQTKIIDGSRTWRENRSYSYTFEVEVISDSDGPKREGRKDGRPFIEAYPGEEYRVRIHNPLPVRVAANLSIDGLNSLTGKPGTPEGGRKWIIEPESWVDITGWPVSDRTARRFVFTSKSRSYAAWRSNSWSRDLSVNCGVIGVAYFWQQRDLDHYYNDHPVVNRTTGLPRGTSRSRARPQARLDRERERRNRAPEPAWAGVKATPSARCASTTTGGCIASRGGGHRLRFRRRAPPANRAPSKNGVGGMPRNRLILQGGPGSRADGGGSRHCRL